MLISECTSVAFLCEYIQFFLNTCPSIRFVVIINSVSTDLHLTAFFNTRENRYMVVYARALAGACWILNYSLLVEIEIRNS